MINLKKTFFLFLVILISMQCVFAEKIPVKIEPAEIISTHNDEVEVGDKIKFKIVSDVYDNDKLFIKKDTPLFATVDYVQPNGWGGDSAEITLKIFEAENIKGEKVIIKDKILIRGTTDKLNNSKQILLPLTWILILVRGSEIFIEPDTRTYNILLDS